MTLKDWVLSGAIGVVALIAITGPSGPAPVTNVVERGEAPLGAAAGPTFTEHLEFLSGTTWGGNGCTATSTTGSAGTLQGTGDTSLARQDVTCVNFTVNQADVTLTLAASTSPWYPQKVGSMKTLWIRNASTTATADIVLQDGTGVNMKVATATAVKIFGDVDAENSARIDFVRQPDTDVAAYISLFTDDQD